MSNEEVQAGHKEMMTTAQRIVDHDEEGLVFVLSKRSVVVEHGDHNDEGKQQWVCGYGMRPEETVGQIEILKHSFINNEMGIQMRGSVDE